MGFNYEAQFDYDVAWAERVIKDDGRLPTTFFVHGKGRSAKVGVPRLVDEMQGGLRHLVHCTCVVHDATALCMVSEIWATRSAAVRPSLSEQRYEAVMVALRWRDDATGDAGILCSVREIFRSTDGAFDHLADRAHEGSLAECGWLDLLPKERPSQAARRRAAAFLKKLGVASSIVPALHHAD